MDISVVIIAKNEADRITRCIEHASFADEVIVLDNGSTDNTITIAKELGAQVYQVDWIGYGQTKNLGSSFASNSWILSLDADEYLSDQLVTEIKQLKLNRGTVYDINRRNIYLDKEIRYSGWTPDWVTRIFHKDDVSWNTKYVHEKLYIPKGHQRKRLSNLLYHNSYRSIEEHRQKTEKYALLKAQMWIDNKKKPSLLKVLFGAGFKAFHSYVIKMGFLDGKAGWQIAKMNAYLVRQQIKMFHQLKNNG